jgi:hypothetical protein
MTTPWLENEARRLGIGSRAEHKESDYRYAREQSRQMRNAEWEERVPALEPAWRGMLSAAIVIAMGVLAFPVIEFVVQMME